VKGGVVEESPPIHRTDGDTGHIGISQHIIDIIEGKDASKELLEEVQPPWMFSPLLLLRPLDEEGNLFRIKDFCFFKQTVGTPPDAF
jgi:hypothetical protein